MYTIRELRKICTAKRLRRRGSESLMSLYRTLEIDGDLSYEDGHYYENFYKKYMDLIEDLLFNRNFAYNGSKWV